MRIEGTHTHHYIRWKVQTLGPIAAQLARRRGCSISILKKASPETREYRIKRRKEFFRRKATECLRPQSLVPGRTDATFNISYIPASGKHKGYPVAVLHP